MIHKILPDACASTVKLSALVEPGILFNIFENLLFNGTSALSENFKFHQCHKDSMSSMKNMPTFKEIGCLYSLSSTSFSWQFTIKIPQRFV